MRKRRGLFLSKRLGADLTSSVRYFGATILGGRLHVTGVPEWGPWDSSRSDYFPEDQIMIVSETGDRLFRTLEELEAGIQAPMGVAPRGDLDPGESGGRGTGQGVMSRGGRTVAGRRTRPATRVLC